MPPPKIVAIDSSTCSTNNENKLSCREKTRKKKKQKKGKGLGKSQKSPGKWYFSRFYVLEHFTAEHLIIFFSTLTTYSRLSNVDMSTTELRASEPEARRRGQPCSN